MFFDMRKYIYYENFFNTLDIEVKHKSYKKFPLDKMKNTKNAHFII